MDEKPITNDGSRNWASASNQGHLKCSQLPSDHLKVSKTQVRPWERKSRQLGVIFDKLAWPPFLLHNHSPDITPLGKYSVQRSSLFHMTALDCIFFIFRGLPSPLIPKDNPWQLFFQLHVIFPPQPQQV